MSVDVSSDAFDRIVEDLAGPGWSVCEGFLEPEPVSELALECRRRWEEGEFHRARVGRGEEKEVRAEIRRDHVFWLDETETTPLQRVYFERMSQLRLAVNRALFLGLWELECHLAVYPAGAFYRKHLDQFQAVQQRTVTCILYLNEAWRQSDGGQLRMYLEPDGEGPFVDIWPRGGTLVSFLSARFYHEVLPSARERLSITGWFKVRAV